MIRLFKVFMSKEAKEQVAETLDSGYIGEGPKVELFEKELQKVFNTDKEILTVNSCTSALDLALHMIGVKAGDEVITTPITCTATNSPIVNRGAIPVWADVNPYTGLINPLDVEKKITKKTKAIMAVNWGGISPDYKHLKSFGLPVIEDAAHGAYWSDQERGNYVCWSFQAIKHLTTGDGGAILCDDPDRARLLRWYGLDRRSGKSFRCEQDIQEVGYKYHMNDIAASIGLSNLPHMKDLVFKHRFNAGTYSTMIKNKRVLYTPTFDLVSSFWIYTLLLDDPTEFKAYMESKGIEVSPVHARNDKHKGFRFPNGTLSGVDYFDKHQMSIPVGWWVTPEERLYIIQCINDWK